jgi:predicted transcriptional regulator
MYALKHAFDGALSPMVQRLIETRDLSAQELDEIEALLRAKRKRTNP